MCRDTNSLNCNPNDDQVCRSGFFTGSNCDVPVTDRKQYVVQARFCINLSTGDTCPTIEARDVRNIAVRLSGVDASLITVTRFEKIDGTCCWKIEFTVAVSSDSNTNVEQQGQTLAQALTGNNGFSEVQTEESSNASFLIPSIVSLIALFFVIFA